MPASIPRWKRRSRTGRIVAGALVLLLMAGLVPALVVVRILTPDTHRSDVPTIAVRPVTPSVARAADEPPLSRPAPVWPDAATVEVAAS